MRSKRLLEGELSPESVGNKMVRIVKDVIETGK